MRVLVAAAVMLAGALTSCASTVPGHGNGGSLSGSGSGSLSGSGSGSGSDSGSGGNDDSCGTGARYCDDFSDTSSGWPSDQKPHFYAGYDTSGGGTYRMGERYTATLTEHAPVRVTSVAPDYAIQADVEATAGPTMDHTSSAGMVCWEHDSSDNQASGAFVFEISGTTAEVFLWRDDNGKYEPIDSTETSVFTFDGKPNHITITCSREGSGSLAHAQLRMSINGQMLIDTTYSSDGGKGPWDVGDSVGLVVGGKGSDVFYDNFALRRASS